MELDKVYKSIHEDSRPHNYIGGTLEIKGSSATVNVYVSNEKDEPVKADMTQDQSAVSGFVRVSGLYRWILVETAAGSPTVNAFGVAIGE